MATMAMYIIIAAPCPTPYNHRRSSSDGGPRCRREGEDGAEDEAEDEEVDGEGDEEGEGGAEDEAEDEEKDTEEEGDTKEKEDPGEGGEGKLNRRGGGRKTGEPIGDGDGEGKGDTGGEGRPTRREGEGDTRGEGDTGIEGRKGEEVTGEPKEEGEREERKVVVKRSWDGEEVDPAGGLAVLHISRRLSSSDMILKQNWRPKEKPSSLQLLINPADPVHHRRTVH